jgi:hypothetical protein
MSALVTNITANARYDLQAPGVLILYEISNSVNGQSSLSLEKDYWPQPLPTDPIKHFAVLQFTVDLQGNATQITTANITTEALNPTDPNWWLEKHPQYKPHDPSNAADTENSILSFTIDGTTITRTPNPAYTPTGIPVVDHGYSNELTTGQITSWMNFGAQRIVLACKAIVIHRNGTQPQEIPLTYQCLSTNATSGTYTSNVITSYAEPIPVSLAQYIYDAISVLQFEGELTFTEPDVSAQLMIGQLFNLTGSANAEWTTMAAQVQEVDEDIDAGVTTVRFGPPKHLSAGELVDLLRVNRPRLVLNVYTMRANGTSSGGNHTVDLGQNTPEKNSVSGTAPANPVVTSSTIDGTGPVVQHQATANDITSTWISNPPAAGAAAGPPGSVVIQLSQTNGQNLYIQQISLCQNGVPGTMYFLCSNFVPDP